MRTRLLNGWVESGIAVVGEHQGCDYRGQQEQKDAGQHGRKWW